MYPARPRKKTSRRATGFQSHRGAVIQQFSSGVGPQRSGTKNLPELVGEGLERATGGSPSLPLRSAPQTCPPGEVIDGAPGSKAERRRHPLRRTAEQQRPPRQVTRTWLPIFYLNPRYILFIHLVVNDMIQVMLSLILFVMSANLHKISFSICCIIILITLFATENTPLNVACMAIECYIAVCLPLRHSRICTIMKTLMLIGLIWVTSMSVVLPDLFVTLVTEPLDFFHSQFVCNRVNAFPNTILDQKRYIIHSVFLVIIWFTIFYTHFRILFTARAASKDSKKARNTIILHGFQVLLCMTTYVGPQLLVVVQRWFLLNYFDSMFAYYIIVHVLPRSITPIIYGVRDETFRKYLRRNIMCECSFTKITR
ncbi:odorant receptor 131-2-like [Antennarius striatus]|uniref:odorant receptor 131-2-like n=1 Tax=Antennarius striatus TaxID=241820 RepID=UPI0035AF6C07